MSDIDLSVEPSAPKAIITPELLEKLKSSHGEIVAVETKRGVAVFRSPNDAEYGRYNALLFDKKTQANAFKALVQLCVVHPTKEVFGEWVAKSPGIVQTCLEHVLQLSGVDTDAQAVKY